MKYIIILGDGMSDEPLANYDEKTPLANGKKATYRLVGKKWKIRIINHCSCNQCILEAKLPIWRFWATMLKKFLKEGECWKQQAWALNFRREIWVLRCNILTIENEKIKNHSAGHISTEEANEIIQFLNEKLGDENVKFYPGVSYRHLLVIKGGIKNIKCTPPHDVPGTPFKEVLPTAKTI